MLKTNYKEDVFEGNRKYRISTGSDGMSEIVDATAYTREGDTFGADDINATNEEVNRLNHATPITLSAAGWGASAPYKQTVTVSGVTSYDSPLISVDSSQARAARKAQEKAFAKYVDRVTTYDGRMVFECDEMPPGIDLKLVAKGV